MHGPAYIASLLKYAVLISGYTMPINIPPPTLMELTHAQMIHLTCNDYRPCTVYGIYRDDDLIKIDPVLIKHDHVSLNGVVVHELTHWLQHHHGKAGFSCKMIGIREREAYAVQNVYIKNVEHSCSYMIPPDWDC